jgi:hypothetical protein
MENALSTLEQELTKQEALHKKHFKKTGPLSKEYTESWSSSTRFLFRRKLDKLAVT